MNRPIVPALLLMLGFLGGCTMPAGQTGGTASATGSAATSATTTGSATTNSSASGAGYSTVYVPPPTGSLLGGGYVRVTGEVKGNDENALLASINQLNAAAGDKEERPYVITAVSRSTGVSERELQAQQDLLQLQFGQLCAINAIARGNSNKVKEVATLQAKGQTWTQLATSNGISIASVVQTARNANQLTISAFTAYVNRAKGRSNNLQKTMNIPAASRSGLPGGGG
jgi:hypothetical protein